MSGTVQQAAISPAPGSPALVVGRCPCGSAHGPRRRDPGTELQQLWAGGPFVEVQVRPARWRLECSACGHVGPWGRQPVGGAK